MSLLESCVLVLALCAVVYTVQSLLASIAERRHKLSEQRDRRLLLTQQAAFMEQQERVNEEGGERVQRNMRALLIAGGCPPKRADELLSKSEAEVLRLVARGGGNGAASTDLRPREGEELR